MAQISRPNENKQVYTTWGGMQHAIPWTVCPCASCLTPRGSGGQTHKCGGGQRSPRCHGSKWPPPEHHGWTRTAPTGEWQRDSLSGRTLRTPLSECVCVSVRLPLSEPGSSSASGHVLGNQEHSRYPDPGSAAACCLSLCRFLSFPHRHCDTSHVKYIYTVYGVSEIVAPPTPSHTHTHTHSLPAVNQYGSHLLCPCPGGCSDEGQDRQSVFWDAHVWPLGVVVMEDRVFNFPLRSLKDEKGCYYVCDVACVDAICVCEVPYLWCLWRWTSAVCSKRGSCCFSGSPGMDRIPPGSPPASTGHILSVERWQR